MEDEAYLKTVNAAVELYKNKEITLQRFHEFCRVAYRIQFGQWPADYWIALDRIEQSCVRGLTMTGRITKRSNPNIIEIERS